MKEYFLLINNNDNNNNNNNNNGGGQNTVENILHELQGNVLNSHIVICAFAIEIKWSIFNCFDRHLLFELVLEVKLACLLFWKAVLTVQNAKKHTLLNSPQIEIKYKIIITIVKKDFLVVWWFSTEQM